MRDKLSGKSMSIAIATEAQGMVREAAQPVSPGEGVGSQILKAWRALGRPPFWRVRAAWYGDAGEWSARAMDDFRARYQDWKAKQIREEAQGRAEAQEHIKRLSALRDHLSKVDQDFFRPDVDALERAIERMGGHLGAVAVREE